MTDKTAPTTEEHREQLGTLEHVDLHLLVPIAVPAPTRTFETLNVVYFETAFSSARARSI
jgi:hypothetical protein